MKSKRWSAVCLLMLLAACGEQTAEPPQAVTKVVAKDHPALSAVKSYYDAVISQNCVAAVKLRPGYSMERCRKVESLALNSAELKAQNQQAAVVALDIQFKLTNSEPTTFAGLALLKNVNGQWQLQESIESYSKLNGLSAEAFLAQHTEKPAVAKTDPEPVNETNKTADNDVRFLMGKFDPAKLPELVTIASRYASRDGMKMDKAAYADFKKMHQAAQQAGVNLVIKSATRNFGYQKGIWEGKWTGKRPVNGANLPAAVKDPKQRALKILQYSAMPGSSRHHWGTDIDLNAFENSYFERGAGKKVYTWLQANAANYGFCQPYTKKGQGRNSGYNEEKWHWSYKKRSQAYTEQARQLLNNGMFNDFQGADTARSVDILGNYILGIDKNCL